MANTNAKGICPTSVLLLLLGLSVTGCMSQKVDDGRPQRVHVSGQVRLEQEPVEGANVVFIPQDHRYTAAGKTDPNGQYQLQTFDPQDGAVPGNFKVIVIKSFVDEKDVEHNLIPARYRKLDKSGFSATVEAEGTNEFNFDLKN